MWAPSYVAEPAQAVNVPLIGTYVPDQPEPRGAGGTAWRTALTPVTVAADGAITFVLFFADLAGLSYGAGDWMTRVPLKPGTSSASAAELPNLPVWFVKYVNVSLQDTDGHDLMFAAFPKDRAVFVTGFFAQQATLSVMKEVDASTIQLAGFGMNIPSEGESSAIATLTIHQVGNGLEIEGSYHTTRDGGGTAHPIAKRTFLPKHP
jgi:hypothetical protein